MVNSKRMEKIKLTSNMDFEKFFNYSSLNLNSCIHIYQILSTHPHLLRYFSKEAIATNLWALNQIDNVLMYSTLRKYVIIGGGCGLLASMIFSYVNAASNYTMTPFVLSIDKNQELAEASLSVNEFYRHNGNYLCATSEVYDDAVNYLGHNNQNDDYILINNAAHKFQNIDKWISTLPKDMNICLIGNEMLFPENSLSEISYQGIMCLPDYSRYLIIGRI